MQNPGLLLGQRQNPQFNKIPRTAGVLKLRNRSPPVHLKFERAAGQPGELSTQIAVGGA